MRATFQRYVALLTILAGLNVVGSTFGQIFRYNTGLIIPGTEDIVPGPGVQLRMIDLNYAALDSLDLRGGDFTDTSLLATDFRRSDLQGAEFSGAYAEFANFADANLTSANFHNAVLSDVDFRRTNLSGAKLGGRTLSGNFSAASLRGTDLSASVLTGSSDFSNADFTDAIIDFASFQSPVGLTKEQLYATANYQAHNLQGISLLGMDLRGANFRRQDLRRAILGNQLMGADFSEANLAYAALAGDMTEANFTGATLSGVRFIASLADADFHDAVIAYASFGPSSAFTERQLRSTASFQQKNLRGLQLSENRLLGWDFTDQDLSRAECIGCALTGGIFRDARLPDSVMYRSNFAMVDLVGADLQFASLYSSQMENADFSGAMIVGANLDSVQGFQKEQLYSTSSYRAHNLYYLGLSNNNLSAWDFRGQNLAKADFFGAKLTEANFKGAIVKGARFRDAIGLHQAGMDGTTVYDQWTEFPDGFDAIARGLSFELTQAGDYNADGVLDETDIDLLARVSEELTKVGFRVRQFDLNSDLSLTEVDRRIWVKDLRRTWYGDTNLDREFNSFDLVNVFQAGQYEDSVDDNSTWKTGDWDGDRDFTTSDLIIAFQDGGYEQGLPSPSVAVPEPTSLYVATCALFIFACRNPRHWLGNTPKGERIARGPVRPLSLNQ